MLKFLTENEIQDVISLSIDGKNTKFLKAAHSLWIRFKNYEKSPPLCLVIENKVVAVCYVAFNRDKCCNFYEIVTIEGEERKGYASLLWKEFLKYSVNIKHMERLKLSCTPSSIGWHLKNGLVFWAIDPSGSLRSDQKIFSTVEEQLSHREEVIKFPLNYLPPSNQIEKFKSEGLENYSFGEKKRETIREAIQKVGNYWLRDYLFMGNSMDSFYD